MASGSYGQAFLLTTIAGLATFIGAALPCFVKLSNINYLVLALSLASGVMAYVSLVEMLSEALENFRKSDTMNPVLGQSLFFFIGIFICIALDYIIKKVSGEENHFEMSDCFENIKEENKKTAELEIVEKLEKGKEEKEPGDFTININCSEDTLHSNEKISLRRLGILTAVAITLHNIPEGVATFSSSLSDMSIGVMLTVAISIHNIPEGLSVAFPIYYSTGSKIKAFLWGALSGLSEPLAALVELVILKIFGIQNGDFTPMAYGIIFATVSGIMTYISLCELLPTAKKYDENGKMTTVGFISGMAIMAVSLIFLDIYQ